MKPRIKTNIIKLELIFCEKEKIPLNIRRMFGILNRIDANRELSMFSNAYEEYNFLYEYTNVDLIGWQIDKGVFDWKRNSDSLVLLTPEYFDAEKFNWEACSSLLLRVCPYLFNREKYSYNVKYKHLIESHDELFYIEKFNWKDSSGYVLHHHPELIKLHPEKFNWEAFEKGFNNKKYPEILKLKPKQ